MSKKFRIFGRLIFLVLFMVCLIVFIKPGAAVFFRKYPVDFATLKHDDGVYRYDLNTSATFYDVETFLVEEGDKILKRIKTEELVSREPGVFSIEEINSENYVVRLIPETEISEQRFRILIQPYFITSSVISVTLLILVGGLLIFLMSIALDSQKRRIILSSPLGVFKLLGEALKNDDFLQSCFLHFKKVWVITSFISFFYIFMEWIFFVTKPSFMDVLNFGDKLGIFFISGFILFVFVLLVSLSIFLLDLIFPTIIFIFPKFFYYVPAALMIVSLGLIMIDNFTYTVFRFGVVNSSGIIRVIYAVLFGVSLIFVVRYFLKDSANHNLLQQMRWKQIVTGGLLVVAVLFTVNGFQPVVNSSSEIILDESEVKTPNIILLSNDGLNAENLSVYGYERETTPFMELLAGSSLVMENNFTNANTSTGSDTALLTGKLPFETHVLYPPNTLQGIDMYEHLPGLLKRFGYKTVSLGVPHFVDVNVINFKNAFDSVNCADNQTSKLADLGVQYGYSDTVYFLTTIAGRIIERVQHIFFIKDMENPYTMVTEHASNRAVLTEKALLNCLNANLIEAKNTGRPLFAHIHLISTHGPKFDPATQVFSKGQVQDQNWMTDFYDDSILIYDGVVEDLVIDLKDMGLYDQTILVLFTDHGKWWTVNNRIPLLIRFPNDQNAGVVSESTQNLDIGPTLLDYIGVPQPDWMVGDSLLGDLDPARLIFVASIDHTFLEPGRIKEGVVQPPFFQFGYLDVIQCENLNRIDLKNLTIEHEVIKGFITPCPQEMLISSEVIWQEAAEMLIDLGYDLPELWGEK